MFEIVLFSGLFLVICLFTQQSEAIQIDSSYVENVYKCIGVAIILLGIAITFLWAIKKSSRNVQMILMCCLIIVNIIDVSRVSLIYLDNVQDTSLLNSANVDEHTFEIMSDDTHDGYRSFVATDNETSFYKEKILNIGKYGRQEVYDLNFYNSWITFIDKKLFYWGLQEIVHYPILNYNMHNETQVISMLSISHIYDAWNHSFDENKSIPISKEYSTVYDEKQLDVYKNNEANQIISIPQEVKQIDYYTDSYLSDGLVDVNKNAYILSSESGSHALVKSERSKIENISWKKNTVACEVESDDETFIVHSQLNYPGWRVYVDGKEYKLYCVNNLIQGTYVPSGHHKVVFSYRPRFLRLGIVLSCIGVVVFVSQIALNNSIILFLYNRLFGKGKDETKTVCDSSVL